jgi:hypothetical protein
MDKKVNQKLIFRCNYCNKNYASSSSLCNHNKKFHNEYVVERGSFVQNNEVVCGTFEVLDKKLYKLPQCKFCNKQFNDRSNKSKHEKICKNKIILEITNVKNENELLKSQIINNIQNINNGIINNNQIIINQVGKETLDGLSLKDILSITKDGNNMPITCIKKVNFNKKFPENHSFCTTTLEGKHFTRINHKTQKPEKINKVDFINEVLDSSLRFINNISLMIEFDESFRDNIPLEHQQKIKDILNNQNKFHEAKNKKAFFNCINDMSYNFKDIILETWKLIQPLDNKQCEIETDSEEPPLIDENFNYMSSSDDEL